MDRKCRVGVVEGRIPGPRYHRPATWPLPVMAACVWYRSCWWPGSTLQRDLAGEQDSWKSTFEAAGIHVRLEHDGLGQNPRIVEIFCRHMEEALDVIPGRH